MKKRVGAHCLNSNLLRTDLRNPTNPVCESCGNRLNGAKALGASPTPRGSCWLGNANLSLITSRNATLSETWSVGARLSLDLAPAPRTAEDAARSPLDKCRAYAALKHQRRNDQGRMSTAVCDSHCGEANAGAVDPPLRLLSSATLAIDVSISESLAGL